MSAAVDLRYTYPFLSDLTSAAGKSRLRLATSGGVEVSPHFFSGSLLSPKHTADILLTLSAISRTRFFSPLCH
jgi:hypothetical protein